MEDEKSCYGQMFPSDRDLMCAVTVKGHVFAYEIERTGWVTGERRTVIADRDNWRECTRCHDLEHCRQLSTGKLLLEFAVGPSGVLR
jgi:hypothetical protein